MSFFYFFVHSPNILAEKFTEDYRRSMTTWSKSVSKGRPEKMGIANKRHFQLAKHIVCDEESESEVQKTLNVRAQVKNQTNLRTCIRLYTYTYM